MEIDDRLMYDNSLSLNQLRQISLSSLCIIDIRREFAFMAYDIQDSHNLQTKQQIHNFLKEKLYTKTRFYCCVLAMVKPKKIAQELIKFYPTIKYLIWIVELWS